MGVTDTLLRLLAPRAEQRAMTLDDFMNRELLPAAAATQATATRISVVLACMRIIADSISTLPWAPYIRVNGERRQAWDLAGTWLDMPHGVRDPNYTWDAYISELVTSLLQDGNAFVYALPYVGPDASELHVLNPQRVDVSANRDGSKRYRIGLGDGTTLTVGAEQIIHIPRPPVRPGTLRGLSPIDEARTAFSMAMDAETYAATYYRSGGVPSGVLEYPGERTQQQADEIKARWNARHAGPDKVGVALLTGGVKYVPIPLTFQQAQFVESRNMSIEDLSRLFGVPLHKLNHAVPGAMSYASVEQNAIGYVVDTIVPLVSRIEKAHDRLLPGPATFLRANLAGLLRGDAASRAQYYKTRLEAGSMSPNEIRRLEDEPAVDGGDTYWMPLNLAPAANAALAAQASASKALQDAGYDEIEAAKLVGLPEPAPKPEPTPPPVPPQLMPGMQPQPPVPAPQEQPQPTPQP